MITFNDITEAIPTMALEELQSVTARIRKEMLARSNRSQIIPKTADVVFEVVCGEFQFGRAEILGRSKHYPLVAARQCAAALLKHAGLTDMEAAAVLDRTHSNVSDQSRQWMYRLACYPAARRSWERVLSKLNKEMEGTNV